MGYEMSDNRKYGQNYTVYNCTVHVPAKWEMVEMAPRGRYWNESFNATKWGVTPLGQKCGLTPHSYPMNVSYNVTLCHGGIEFTFSNYTGIDCALPANWSNGREGSWNNTNLTVVTHLNLTMGVNFTKDCFKEWPTPRERAVTWFTGELAYLFGGWGVDDTGRMGELNDLWQFSAKTGAWAFLSGSNLTNATSIRVAKPGINTALQPGEHFTDGTSTSTEGPLPGGRSGAVGFWADTGVLWLFGGEGRSYNSTQNHHTYDHANATWGMNNELWSFSLANNTWAWLGGNSSTDDDWRAQLPKTVTGLEITGDSTWPRPRTLSAGCFAGKN